MSRRRWKRPALPITASAAAAACSARRLKPLEDSMTFALTLDQTRIAVVGLGYVGLPLAAALGREFPTLGFDIDAERVAQLESGRDATGEVDAAELAAATGLRYSA